MAMEDGKPNTMSKAMQDIISACTEGDLDLKNLSPFDLEYFFLQLRGKSVGDIIDLTFRKPDSIECGEKNENCQEVCNIQINIDDIKVDTKRIKNNKIELSDSIGIKMNYPQFDMIQKFANLTDQTAKTDDIFKVINGVSKLVNLSKDVLPVRASLRLTPLLTKSTTFFASTLCSLASDIAVLY